jgi:hypothetical protein
LEHEKKFGNIFDRKRTKRWEHDKKNWSMKNKFGALHQKLHHAPIFLSCSHIFDRKRTEIWEYDKKSWSMKKYLGA